MLPLRRSLVLHLGLGLSLLLGSAAHAACLASAQGEWAGLETLAFRAPAQALPELQRLLAPSGSQTSGLQAAGSKTSAAQTPVQRATLLAMLADATRQLSQDDDSRKHAEAGLAALAPDTDSDLALRLRAARAVELDNVEKPLAVMDANLASAAGRPLATGCLLRDRGWHRLDNGDLEGALSDLIQSYELLTKHSDRDQQVVAMGRLSIAFVNAGDHPAALALIDETIEHFRKTDAPVRLSTALQRRTTSLARLKRWPEAEAASREALAVSLDHGDLGGAGFVTLRLCGLVGQQDREAEALALCDMAEKRLRQANALDGYATEELALLRIEVLRTRAPNASELVFLQKAVVEATRDGNAVITRLLLQRAKGLAAQGQHPAAYADMKELLRLQRVATDGERIKAQAALRVRFETDRALARSAVLDKQNQLNQERLWWAAAAAAGLLAAVGGLVYTLVLSRRHRTRLTEVAERDELTRLPNRRKILAVAEQEFAQARRRHSTLVVGVLDIDHFKRINDQHGHDGGDRVLRAFGGAATVALRGTDSLGRWGGEEFLLLLPDCPMDAACQVAERLRDSLATFPVPADTGAPLRFSVSIGLATAGPDDSNLLAVLQRADMALYAAKAQGRNRVVVHGAVHELAVNKPAALPSAV
jgi:diguanylate cyclase (GGDEF)-like protein